MILAEYEHAAGMPRVGLKGEVSIDGVMLECVYVKVLNSNALDKVCRRRQTKWAGVCVFCL